MACKHLLTVESTEGIDEFVRVMHEANPQWPEDEIRQTAEDDLEHRKCLVCGEFLTRLRRGPKRELN